MIRPSILEFNFRAPSTNPLNLEDMAYALAREGRYCNLTEWPQSVAFHSIMVGDRCPTTIEAFGYLHDGSEAFMRDLPKVLKEMCRDYQHIERDLQAHIYQTFCGRLPTEREEKIIKAIDRECAERPHQPQYCEAPYIERLWLDKVSRALEDLNAKDVAEQPKRMSAARFNSSQMSRRGRRRESW